MKKFDRAGLVFAAMVAILACQENDEHADYGNSGLGGGGAGGGGADGDADGDSDSDSDTDTDTDASGCASFEVEQKDLDLCWRRCPVGQTWESGGCSGDAVNGSWYWANSACSGVNALYRTATLDDFLNILSDCDPLIVSDGADSFCNRCEVSPICDDLLGSDEKLGDYWTSSSYDNQPWFVQLSNGAVAKAVSGSVMDLPVLCVRDKR